MLNGTQSFDLGAAMNNYNKVNGKFFCAVDRDLLINIHNFYNDVNPEKNKGFFWSTKNIAEHTLYSERTIKASFQRLEQMDFIERRTVFNALIGRNTRCIVLHPDKIRSFVQTYICCPPKGK